MSHIEIEHFDVYFIILGSLIIAAGLSIDNFLPWADESTHNKMEGCIADMYFRHTDEAQFQKCVLPDLTQIESLQKLKVLISILYSVGGIFVGFGFSTKLKSKKLVNKPDTLMDTSTNKTVQNSPKKLIVSDSEIWFGSFIILIIIILGFVISSFAAGDQSIREFSNNTSLILIPIVAGGIVTKFTTDSWQITKEKNIIKKQILEKYNHFIPKMYSSFIIFAELMYRKYVDFPNSKYDQNTGTTKYTILPITSANNPHAKFSADCDKFRDEYWQTTFNGNEFLRYFRFYYQNSELEKELLILRSKLGAAYVIFEQFIYCKDEKEFEEYYEKITNMNKTVREEMKKFESKLINTNLIFK